MNGTRVATKYYLPTIHKHLTNKFTLEQCIIKKSLHSCLLLTEHCFCVQHQYNLKSSVSLQGYLRGGKYSHLVSIQLLVGSAWERPRGRDSVTRLSYGQQLWWTRKYLYCRLKNIYLIPYFPFENMCLAAGNAAHWRDVAGVQKGKWTITPEHTSTNQHRSQSDATREGPDLIFRRFLQALHAVIMLPDLASSELLIPCGYYMICR